jgi:hypothetical protein
MDNKDEGKSEKFFRDFGKKVDQFVEEVKDAGDRAEVEMKKRLEELRQTGEKLRGEMKDKEKWKEVEASLKNAGKELENAFKTAFSKKKKEE